MRKIFDFLTVFYAKTSFSTPYVSLKFSIMNFVPNNWIFATL